MMTTTEQSLDTLRSTLARRLYRTVDKYYIAKLHEITKPYRDAERYIKYYKRTIHLERNPQRRATRKARYEKACALLVANKLREGK